MHELSIVMSIIDLAEEQVRTHGAQKVDRIDLEIGTLAGIEMDALDFSWEAAVRETVLDGAERHVEIIAGRGRCVECGLEFEAADLFTACPACQAPFTEILQGKELRVRSLVVS
ncbi:MAG: hydrogenase maturation nickel metallochaperone HypA [Saprospiraceae bacterium]|nr:hydrogenase maturation nickel metallochaperone HypA [Saprospiraceae bacterium]MCB0622452.1 hydrogenase maturation nickel metallochaperone HypA [Saprospiraceae bacterium]MCB0678139.1 hydrogenase maturation nickel metallochaperone HypA [Saprospiraceae bacterium]MCB0680912.1 hydrogenase maturation nickel metallochaperone HypA [Saprospiraceae bacterium]